MPELPSAESVYGQRRAPRPQRSVQGYRTGDIEQAQVNAGKALAEQADDIDKMFEKRKEEKSKLDIARAQSYVLKQTTELETNLLQDPDYATHPEKWNSSFSQIRSNALNMIPSENRELFGYALEDINTAGFGRLKKNMFDMQSEDYRAKIFNNDEDTKKIVADALAVGDTARVNTALILQQKMYEAGIDTMAFPRDTGTKAMIDARYEAIEAGYDSLPLPEQEKLFTPTQGVSSRFRSFDESVNFVIDTLENTPEVTPDGKGNVRFGINSVANPDIDLNTLTKDGAKKIYKDRYWDAIGADKLPENIRFAAFDSAVVQGVGRTKEWLRESNNDPQKFMELRREGFSEIGGENLEGWNSRLDIVGGATRYGNILDQLPPDVVAAKKDAMERKIEAELPKRFFNQYKFSSPDDRAAALASAGNKESLVKANSEIDTKLKEDPAAYVASAPEVVSAMEKAQADPSPENYSAALGSVAQKQKEMGLPDALVRYLPKDATDNLKNIAKSENATSSQLITEVDNLRALYEPVWGHALAEIYNSEISGPIAELAGMDQNPYRTDMAEAILLREDRLKEVASVKESITDLEKKIDDNSIFESFSEANRFDTYGRRLVAQKKEGIRYLAMYNMGKGQPMSEAIKSAASVLIPFEIDDTMILSKGTPIKEVMIAAEDMKSKLESIDILLQPELEGAGMAGFFEEIGFGDVAAVADKAGFGNRITRTGDVELDTYKKLVINQIKPVHKAGKIVFLLPDGNPVLDKSKLKYNKKTGIPENVDEAMVSFDVADVLKYSEDAVNVPDSIGNLRARLSQGIGQDVNQKYFNYNSPPIFGVNKTVAPIITSNDQFNSLNNEQKKSVVHRVRENHKYLMAVVNSIPESKREEFKKYVAVSNSLMSEFSTEGKKPNLGPGKSNLYPRLESQALRSIGYNYLELPEWAKE